MKNIIAIAVLVLGIAFSSYAQPPGANQEAFIGYTVGYGPVALTVNPTTGVQTNDRKEFTHGFSMAYTYFFHRSKNIKTQKLGIGMDANAQFFDGDPVFGTATAGLVYKVNADGKVQPFVRVMGGEARLRRRTLLVGGVPFRTDGWSPVIVAGAGFDIAKDPATSRLKWRVSADYVRTTFGDRTQQVVRATTGLVF